MTTSPQDFAAAYQACLNEALKQFPPLIHRWCIQLVSALHDRSLVTADSAEKRQLQSASVALKNNQYTFEQDFVVQVIDAMARDTGAVGVKKVAKGSRSISRLDFDDLELMGDSQVQEAVDSARLLQIIATACEAGLADFSARLSTAQGFTIVKTDTNPLRPEIVSSALLSSLQNVSVDKSTHSRWLTHGSQIMGQELQSLYVLLNQQLAEKGIAPAAYTVIQSPAEKTVKSAAPAQSQDANFSVEKSGKAALLTLDHLHSLLVGDYDESFKRGQLPSDFQEESNHGFSHTVPDAMDVLADLKSKGIASSRARKARITPPQSLAQMREQLKTEAKSLGQSLAIEVVGLMIEQMANDPRLLPKVREVIANSEPAFLRLGVNDPRFFSNKGHPGRRLLEAITAESLAYSHEEAPGFIDFFHDLQDVATELTEEHASDAQHFATLLQAFENKLASRSAANNESRSRAVQALLQAEQRNLLAEKIAIEIRARADFVSGNRIVTGFLTGPWAQVMAKERLGETGATGMQKAEYSLTLGEVLWSLDPAQTSRHRKRLLKIIPGMLDGVRAGLLSIDYPLADSKAFFDELMQIHQAALRSDASLKNESAKIFNDFEDSGNARDMTRSKKLWLAPTEAQNSGFVGDLGHITRPSFLMTESPDATNVVAQPPASNSGSVEVGLGAWVELLSEDKWIRAQLTWISPYKSLFMFTSEGGRTHSMTSPLLQYLLLQDLVRVISDHGVVEGALNSVARAAMRNSVDGGQGR